MRKELELILSPFRYDPAQTARRLGFELPASFLHEHRALLASMGRLLDRGGPLHVFEYGAGELEGADARHISQLCAALARKTEGTCTAHALSASAATRAGEAPGKDLQVFAEEDARIDLPAGRTFDLIVHHPFPSARVPGTLRTFWAFLQLQAHVSPGAMWVFTSTSARSGSSRCEHVHAFMHALGRRPFLAGDETAWEQPPPRQWDPSLVSTGAFEPLPATLGFDESAFLRLYDQMFAPVLGPRAGTFRSMFRWLLTRPGPYTVIETGTTRESGDVASNGQSTVIFDLFVNTFGGRVISIDVDPTNIRFCATRTSTRTTLICGDSVRALHALPEVAEAQLIYLDSYDFDGNNPHPSSLHHLVELAAVWGRTPSPSLLVIDDCFGPRHGKHAYVADFLEACGIPPLFAGYQTGWVLETN